MPELSLRQATLTDAFVPISDDHGWDVAADLWLYPASAPVSGILVAACALVLRRRGRAREGTLWLAAWFAGTLIEIVTKHALERPALFSHGRHVLGFDDSLPSGHAMRSFLLAAVVASLWARGRLAWLWAVVVWILLIVEGWHTPTDVLAGLLLGALLTLTVREFRPSAPATG